MTDQPQPTYVALPKRHDTCQTCNGRAYFVPQPGYEPPSGSGDPGHLSAHVPGVWVHLDKRDWLDNPHPVKPAEGTTT